MKLRAILIIAVFAISFLATGNLYAGNGDLIVNGNSTVNGNLGVGTSTPAAKAEVNGDMIVDGSSTVKGNTTTTGTTTMSGTATMNGNAIVNGNLGVGTSTPASKAEINGNAAIKGNMIVDGTLAVSGVTFAKIHYENLDEDVYGIWVGSSSVGDTCNNDNSASYTCSPTEEKTCVDVSSYLDNIGQTQYHRRTITCRKNGYLTIR